MEAILAEVRGFVHYGRFGCTLTFVWCCTLQMKTRDPAFDYAIQRGDCGAPVTVMWMTGRHKELLATFGDVVFMDGKWGGANNLNWPFVAIGGVDQEMKVRMFAHAFACAESNGSYKYVHITFVLVGSSCSRVQLLTSA